MANVSFDEGTETVMKSFLGTAGRGLASQLAKPGSSPSGKRLSVLTEIKKAGTGTSQEVRAGFSVQGKGTTSGQRRVRQRQYVQLLQVRKVNAAGDQIMQTPGTIPGKPPCR